MVQKVLVAVGSRLVISTWEELKQRVKRQFFPHNVEEQARRTLCGLRQTGSIREYVQSFQVQACLLSITDMSEKDKLFFFKEGLKPWARAELQRSRVMDLDSKIAQAESLVDYQSELRRDSRPETGHPPKGVENNKSNGAYKKNGGGDHASTSYNNAQTGQGPTPRKAPV